MAHFRARGCLHASSGANPRGRASSTRRVRRTSSVRSHASFLVTTHPGGEQALEEELREILGEDNGDVDLRVAKGGVHFEGEDSAMHRVNLRSRSGIRVLQRVKQVDLDPSRPAGETLYEAFRDALPWGEWLDRPDKSFSISAHIWNNSNFSNSQLVQKRGRDAICDSVREKRGHRPLPPPKGRVPEVPLSATVVDDVLTLYLDTSGQSLHKRGFKSNKIHRASLNECAAATMLRIAGIHDALKEQREELVVVDPFCGSGTILTEAALAAGNIAPGLYRRYWPFYSWPTFDGSARASWEAAVEEARADRRPDKPNVRLLGNDIHQGALGLAMENIQNAGVKSLVKLRCGDVGSLALPGDANGALVVTNPPWGVRLDGEQQGDVQGAWKKLGSFLKSQPGATAYIMSGNSDCTQYLKLRSERRHPIMVGGVKCKILKYSMY
jgi:putative N6-adenine-specific DNA methylase